MSNDVKLFRLSGSALAIDMRTGHNATLRPGLVVLSEDAHTFAMAGLEAECERLRVSLKDADAGMMLFLEQRNALAAELQALKAQGAGQSPAGWQARFTSSGDKWDAWQPCSKEHFELVKSCPAEWPGYEVREVFAAPPAAQEVSTMVEALEHLRAVMAGHDSTPEEFNALAFADAQLAAHRQAQQQEGEA